jgi:hypothetical protein
VEDLPNVADHQMAVRIRARAIRRCGELLKAMKPAKNQHEGNGARGGVSPSRAQAARDAGLSRDQKHTALRLAKTPESDFDAAVDRLRRVLNAVRDAQEMLERLVRTGPVASRSTLSASIEDLEWTAVELSTALAGLQEPDSEASR